MYIKIQSGYSDMIAHSILKMADEHKNHCPGQECTITLFPFRNIVSQLLDRPLTKNEELILS